VLAVQRPAMLGRLDAGRRALCSWRPCSWLPGLYRAALSGLVAWAWQHCLRAVWPFTIDDARISCAHAQHLAEGRGPVAVVGGPWVEGYSNPLWSFCSCPFGDWASTCPSWRSGETLEVDLMLLGVLALASAALLVSSATRAPSLPRALSSGDARARRRRTPRTPEGWRLLHVCAAGSRLRNRRA